jgi:hypothetical protein
MTGVQVFEGDGVDPLRIDVLRRIRERRLKGWSAEAEMDLRAVLGHEEVDRMLADRIMKGLPPGVSPDEAMNAFLPRTP